MLFKLIWKYEKGGNWVEIMQGSRDAIYEWIDNNQGYGSKIERVK